MTPYEGPLDLDRLKSFLQSMRAGRERGCIEVTSNDAKRMFWMDVDNVRISTLGNRRAPNLGELLVLHCKLTPEQLKLCLETQKRLRIRFSEVIAVMGILPQEEVRNEVLAQIQEELCEAFTWPTARMKLTSEFPESEMMKTSFGAIVHAVDALELAQELVRRVDEWKLVRLAIPDPGQVVRFTAEGRKFHQTMRRNDPLRPLLALVDGQRSVDAVVTACPLPRFEAHRAIYLLHSQGYLEIPGAKKVDVSALQSKAPSPAPTTVTRAATQPTPPGGAGLPAAGPRKPAILVIEDLAHIRRILAYELDRAGYQVYEAAGGREGLQLLENVTVELVITDVMMPEMDGMQVCREIRHQQELAGLPVLVITAQTRSDQVAQILAAGASDYLFKPYKREQLLEKVGALLKKN